MSVIVQAALTLPRSVQAFLRRTRSGFAPTDISGLKLWLPADGTLWQDSGRTTPATADTDPVGSWDDAGSDARHMSQTTSVNRPILKTSIINGKPILRFDGTFAYMDCAAMTGGTWFYVLDATGFTVANEIGCYVTGGDSGYTGRIHPDQTTLYTGDANDVVGFSQNGNGYINGASTQTIPSGFCVISLVRSSPYTPSVSRWGLGWGQFNAARLFIGDIAEVIVYDTSLGTTDRQSVENYLLAKYAI